MFYYYRSLNKLLGFNCLFNINFKVNIGKMESNLFYMIRKVMYMILSFDKEGI